MIIRGDSAFRTAPHHYNAAAPGGITEDAPHLAHTRRDPALTLVLGCRRARVCGVRATTFARTPPRLKRRDARPLRPQRTRRQAQDRDRQARRPGRRSLQARSRRARPRDREGVDSAPTACKAEVQGLRAQIAVKTANIASATGPVRTRAEAPLASASRASYRQGDWFYFDLLLGSTDMRDLITRTELVNRVIHSNNDVAAQLASTQDDARTFEGRTRPHAAECERQEAGSRGGREASQEGAGHAPVQGRRPAVGPRPEVQSDGREQEERFAPARDRQGRGGRVSAHRLRAVVAQRLWPVQRRHGVAGPRLLQRHVAVRVAHAPDLQDQRSCTPASTSAERQQAHQRRSHRRRGRRQGHLGRLRGAATATS